MVLKIHDTLTGEKREFKPLHGNRVYMFVCGPTVYDYSHVGHARVYVFFDVVARYLRYKGYSVFYIMNITDIDDKIINRAKEEGVSWRDIAETYTKFFLEDMERLNVKSVNLYAKATEHIPEIIDQIKTLIDKGYAYEANGNVYFDVRKFKDYGKLSKQKLEDLIHGARVEVDPNKRFPADFALWKAWKEGEPYWESPWGRGRPGWHIEDTAITLTYFGPQYDIHGGGIDLIFPHHECEIAQAEAATGKKPFVRYWMHNELLWIEGQKMSKSLGNIVTIREALSKHDFETIRLFLLSTHYRRRINYSERLLKEAEKKLERMYSAIFMLEECLENPLSDETELEKKFMKRFKLAQEKVIERMDDDFDTSGALTEIYVFMKDLKSFLLENGGITAENGEKILKWIREDLSNIFGIFTRERRKLPAEKLIDILVNVRSELRKRKIYDLADKIREHLKKIGVELEDIGDKTVWRLKGTT